MFPRKVKNRSGSISVQIISKATGRYKVIQTLGTSKDLDEVERLWQEAQRLVRADHPDQCLFPFMESETDQAVQNSIEALTNASIRTIGPELIFGTLFDRIGFNQIPDDFFRHLVITRLAYPTSKLKTIDYLYRYTRKSLSISALYRSLDQLLPYKSTIEQIVYEHTHKRLGQVSVVFYDMTTLHFEAEDEDDLRKIGFSKDGKFQSPQIMLGLLVGEKGLPLGYDLFEGNTFEGHTLLPILEQIQNNHGLQKPIVVADAAMLSKSNLKQLTSTDYQFILGARIKNESEVIKQEILEKSCHMNNGDSIVLARPDETRLIVTYSKTRAQKDAKNRDKGLCRLEKQMKSGRLTKQHINNRGYNKFLQMTGDVSICIDENKVKHDQKWDGLKGYLTNSTLTPSQVIENYSHLWQIEKAFRISKTDLRIRPVYHYRKRRIEAHLCVAFAAYAIYKELEMLLQKKSINMSAKRAGELTHNMYQIQYTLPDSKQQKQQILTMDHEQQILFETVHEP